MSRDSPRELLQLLWRRRLLIAVTLVVVTGAALVFSLSQEDRYQAEADVLISRQNLANALTGTEDPYINADEDRFLRTQATIAGNSVIALAALASTGTEQSPDDFFERAEVVENPLADVLTFRVEDPDPETAETLALAWAESFSKYKRELDTASIEQARSEVESRLEALADEGDSVSTAQLEQKAQELATFETLQTSNARVIEPIAAAEQTAPTPLRNTVFGAVIGLFLALILAFLRDTFDTRVRDADEVSGLLRLPLLGRVPSLPKQTRGQRGEGLEIDREPFGPYSEAVRSLRTQVELGMIGIDHPSLLVTSALNEEGKTTVVVNLAVTMARTGRRVLVIDLDLRRPTLHEHFGLDPSPGFTDMLLGRMGANDAIRDVSASIGIGPELGGEAGGRLQILAAGSPALQPSELLSSIPFAHFLKHLSTRNDIMLLDSAPLLPVADSVSISAHADAMLLLLRRDELDRKALRESERILEGCSTRKLGFVLTRDDSLLASDMYYAPEARSVGARNGNSGPDGASPDGRGDLTAETSSSSESAR